MPITPVDLQTNMYTIALPVYMNVRNNPVAVTVPPFAGAVRYRGEHIHYPTADLCVASAIATPNPMLTTAKTFGGAYAGGGDTYFLPYDNNHITSIRLPSPAPGGIAHFVTANLSGCRFFVDTITGSTDLMVYHANTQAHGSPPTADAEFQSVNASTVLDQMLTDARLDLAPLALVGAASCVKNTYFRPAGNAERTLKFLGKRNSGIHTPHRPRNEPSFDGGCTVMGFYGAAPVAGWQFWWQCWGSVPHTDPDTVTHRFLIPDKVTPGVVQTPTKAVMGVGRIY